MMKLSLAPKSSFRKKMVIYGAILSIVSVLITTLTCYYVSNKLLLDQFQYVNGIATNAAIEKTNTYLGEIASIINLSMKFEYFDRIINPTNLDAYQQIDMKNNYKAYLQNMILYNDKIDALIVINRNTENFTISVNSVGKNYNEYHSGAFFSLVQQYAENNPLSQFFLNKYHEGNYKRIAIISPVKEPYSNIVQAFVVIVLSEKLMEDLQFSGDQILITDNTGTSATLVESNDGSLNQSRFTFNNQLNFDGWEISNTFTYNKIQKTILDNLFQNLIIGGLCFFISMLLFHVAGKRLVYPLVQMEEQIATLNHNKVENRPIFVPSKKVSFRHKLLFLYSILVTIPVIFITISSYTSSTSIAESKIGSVFEYSANILYQQIEFSFQNYIRTIIEISTVNKNIQKDMHDLASPDIENKLQLELNSIMLSDSLLGGEIANISIYDTSYNLICSSTFGHPFMTREDVRKDLDFIKGHFGTMLWRSYPVAYFNTSCIRVGMQIRDSTEERAGTPLGYILVDYGTNDIQSMLNNFFQYSDVTVSINDSLGMDALKMDADSYFNGILEKGNTHITIPLNNLRISFNSNGDSYLALFKKFKENGWFLVFLIKNFNENSQILYYSISVLIGLLLLSFVFSYGFSSILSTNISTLMKTVQKVKSGDMSVRYKGKFKDEIGELGNSFNNMLDRLNKLIEEKYISEVKTKDAEIKMKEYELNLLQAQINPHFLYNTLKTVQYMVFSHDERAEHMIKLLINLFRTGMIKGEKLVSVREEMEHIRIYIEIQKMRFSDKFTVNYDIPDDILRLQILKLTIQPIVENAIYHGLEVNEGKGIINITAIRSGKKILFTVYDNGIGISEEKLFELKNQLLGKKDGRSIGLTNVHERIKLYFGEEYGLVIDSVSGHGTTVQIWLPMLEDTIMKEVKKTD